MTLAAGFQASTGDDGLGEGANDGKKDGRF